MTIKSNHGESKSVGDKKKSVMKSHNFRALYLRNDSLIFWVVGLVYRI